MRLLKFLSELARALLSSLCRQTRECDRALSQLCVLASGRRQRVSTAWLELLRWVSQVERPVSRD
jgi:hypothetical protein